ncbi:MAG TPA: TetR/AcrR family transcriptional regulator [Gemmatimonadales bacterium]|nr:TetR/AcrR family transcriptional regulator [Gemmatimonadales bacterium]
MPISGQSRRGSATREKLLVAARELFANRGYHATTTALLADRTGIAEGTIYRHFDGKDALYSAVCRGVWERFETLALDPATATEPAKARLAATARRFIAEAARSPSAVKLHDRPVEATALDESARRARERLREALTQLIAAGKQEGSIRAGTAELWSSLWSAVIWSVCERVVQGDWTADHPNTAAAIDAAWEMIAARESSTSRLEA